MLESNGVLSLWDLPPLGQPWSSWNLLWLIFRVRSTRPSFLKSGRNATTSFISSHTRALAWGSQAYSTFWKYVCAEFQEKSSESFFPDLSVTLPSSAKSVKDLFEAFSRWKEIPRFLVEPDRWPHCPGDASPTMPGLANCVDDMCVCVCKSVCLETCITAASAIAEVIVHVWPLKCLDASVARRHRTNSTRSGHYFAAVIYFPRPRPKWANAIHSTDNEVFLNSWFNTRLFLCSILT